jgi:methyl-accepting chemotaxis protein
MTNITATPNMLIDSARSPERHHVDRPVNAISDQSAGKPEGSTDKELTRTRLLRFGAIIAAMILATLGITVWSLRSSAADVDATRVAGDARAASDKTSADGLSIIRARLNRSLALYSGDDALVARFSTEGAADVAQLETDLAEAVAAAMAAPVEGMSAADTAALGDVGVKGTAVAEMEALGKAYIDTAKGFWTEDKLVLSSATFDDSRVAFNNFNAAQKEVTALELRSEEGTKQTSGTNSTRAQLLALLGSLAALATFGVIGRRVMKSVAASQQLTIEVADAQGRERQLSSDSQSAATELQMKVDSMLATLSAAAAGDLTAQVSVSGDDAVGRMGEALSKLLRDLRSSISSIASNSETLAAASEELQSVAGQMGANSSETSNQVNLVSGASVEVTTNIETASAAAVEMTASIKEIAKNASDAAKVATQAVEAARLTNATVAQLGESSAEIGEIVKVITGIAQQTNLLALNATIEAARAGEAGKGFAVVANEVKELAKETAKATEDISEKIAAIQTDTQRSVESISGILEIINQIAEFQNTIASAVEEQAATTSEIARSVTDASRGSSEITANIHTVAAAADSTAAGAHDSQRAATELARMAADLQTLVSQFTY